MEMRRIHGGAMGTVLVDSTSQINDHENRPQGFPRIPKDSPRII
jgi:hypothetical protein